MGSQVHSRVAQRGVSLGSAPEDMSAGSVDALPGAPRPSRAPPLPAPPPGHGFATTLLFRNSLCRRVHLIILVGVLEAACQ